MRNHHNRSFRLRLYAAVRCLIAVVAYASIALPTLAVTVKDFDAKPAGEQAAFLAGFIEKMTSDLMATNPPIAQSIRAWFVTTTDSKPASEGLERLVIELSVLEDRARQGKADLSQIQVEGVVVTIVKEKFPPHQSLPASAAASFDPFDAPAVIEQWKYVLGLEQKYLEDPPVKRFQAWLPAEQIACLGRMVEEKHDFFVRQYPEDAARWNALFERAFAVNQGQVSLDGIKRINARLEELDSLAQGGSVDLSDIRMRDVVSDVLASAIDAQQKQLHQRMQEIKDNAIKLHDGRRVYVDGENFRDESGEFLRGADLAEARQKYRERQ